MPQPQQLQFQEPSRVRVVTIRFPDLAETDREMTAAGWRILTMEVLKKEGRYRLTAFRKTPNENQKH